MKLLTFSIIALFIAAVSARCQVSDFLDPGHLPYLKNSKLVQISSHDTTGGNFDAVSIKPGETKVLADVGGPGIIVRIWVTISARDRYFLRRILLRIFWDHETNPSVEVPIGDFFGTGFEYTHFVSYFVGMSSGGYFSYFPMPFERNARVEVVNETGKEIPSFYYQIDYQKLDSLDTSDLGYFHAQWRREPKTSSGRNYLVFEAEGEGQFIGMNLQIQGYREKNLSFLEGDEFIYVDGEVQASIRGTGTEDYFTSGWYFNRGTYAGPFHGLIMKDDTLLSRIVAYRFHLGDQIPFKKSIRFEIEHGHASEALADYSSVAYWYQKEPHKPFEPILSAPRRIPLRVAVPEGAIEAESLVAQARATGGVIETLDMSSYGVDWSGDRQLVFRATGPGDEARIVFPVETPDKYLIHGYITRGPAYGKVEVWIARNKVAEYDAFSPEIVPGGKVEFGRTRLSRATGELIVRVVGKNDNGKGYDVGLDAIVLVPDRDFIRDWYVIGPFDNSGDERYRVGLTTVYEPEREIDIERTYQSVERKQVRWKKASTNSDGYVNLNTLFMPNDRTVAYGLAYVHSPDDRDAVLYLGSDDGVRVWLNSQLVHDKPALRPATPDQDTIPLFLRKGWNTLLVKVEENLGGWGFYARIPNVNDDLVFATEPNR